MNKIAVYLSYLGIIPFIFCALCLRYGIEVLPLLGSVQVALSVYGLVIASFLAGAHWGQHLHLDSCSLPLVSNILAVLLWIGFLVLSFKMQMMMFVVIFTLLLAIDYRLLKQGVITRDYFYVRFLVSVIVMIVLIFS